MVDGVESLVHGLGVDEELEGGARLVSGPHVVHLPEAEVDVAHPGPDQTGVGLDGYKP